MATQQEYRIYCITESQWVSTWATSPPSQCPNNVAHTVNPNSVQELEISLTNFRVSSTADPAFTTTFLSTQTTDKTITIPDDSTMLVGTDTTQSLTNKTLECVGTGNTVEATHLRLEPIATTVPTSNQILQYQSTQWEIISPSNFQSNTLLFDDFFKNSLSSKWVTSVTGGSSSVLPIDGLGGQVRLTSGPNIGNSAQLHSGIRVMNAGSNGQLSFRIKLSSTTNTIVRVGGYTSTTDAIDFYVNNTTGGNWYSRTMSATTSTTMNTGVAVSTNWVIMRINLSTPAVQFYINNTLVTTHNTNIPSALLRIYTHQESASASSRNTTLDYVLFSSDRDTPTTSASFNVLSLGN